jgi:hypothetical protein
MINTCPNCNADLTKEASVSREYINKNDDGENIHAEGHYDSEGYFEPERHVDLSQGRFDLCDGSDTCTQCNHILQ